MIFLKNLTFAVKVVFVLFALVWIICGFSFLLFHATLIPILWSKAAVLFSSVFCMGYLILGIYVDDFGESETDYKKRCEDAGLDTNDV